MSEQLCTVDFAAEQLKLHPKTVLRFIREGRLRATRVGKSYRILRAHLDAFAGIPARAVPPVDAARITAIIDIAGVEPELARSWATRIPGALQGKPQGGAPLRADVVYEPERSQLKIVIVGAAAEALDLLSLIRIWLAQPSP